MDAILEPLKPVLVALGAEPWMYPVLVAFGIAHQYAKGTMKQWTSHVSLVSAGVFALAFGIASWFEHNLAPVGGLTRIVVLFSAAMLAEAAAERAAAALPFVPKNNEWTKEGDPK